MKAIHHATKTTTLMLMGLLMAGLQVAAQTPARRGMDQKQAQAVPRLKEPPRIDGTLDDPAWQKAARFKDFKTFHPMAGKPPSERTEIYLTYDHENIYLGVHAFDSEPDKVRATGTQRDNPSDDDWVAFCVDSRDQALNAEFFLVTPKGNQVDGTLDANGGPNLDFNARWSSAAKQTADGWISTMAIPFKALPFHWDDQVEMRFKVARLISRRSEEVDFPELVPAKGPQLTQFQPVRFAAIERGLPADLPPVNISELYQRKLGLRSKPDIGTYEGRLKSWGDPSVFDYLVFPARELRPGVKPFRFEVRPDNQVPSMFRHLEYLPGREVGDLDTILQNTQTTSFIVIKDDRVIYEKYFNGYSRDSIVTSFSVAKSFDSTLVGIAIDEGLIGGVSDPITKYLPELAKRDVRFSQIKIKDLLTMSSGIRYEEDAPRHDDWLTYLYPDLRELALQKTEIVEGPDRHWLYNNYNPVLVGMILERVTGKSLTQYLQEKVWSPLGMEYLGSWSINTETTGLEKMESGINARAIDFAKFGDLILREGRWQGEQIVSANWIIQATQPDEKSDEYYDHSPFFVAEGHYYKYFWWGCNRTNGKSDFYGIGNKGQYIYISPQKNLVIVRNGIDYGLPSSRWVSLFYDFATALPAH